MYSKKFTNLLATQDIEKIYYFFFFVSYLLYLLIKINVFTLILSANTV